MKLQDCFIGQNVGVNSKSMGILTGELNDSYANVGYYSNVESFLSRLNNEVVLSHLQGLDSLDELVRVTESYLSKLHDSVQYVVKELRK